MSVTVERADATYREVELGFHGDAYLLALVDALLDRAEAFVETGTNVGSTLRYVAARRPQLPCLSCEPDPEALFKQRMEQARSRFERRCCTSGL